MAAVQYGRRKGSSLRSQEGVLRNTRLQEQKQEEKEVAAHKVAVIPANEWLRIRASLDQKERERQDQNEAVQRRLDRKLQSQNIVKHWENTIEGQRLKKLQARKQREEKEEEEKVKIDEEEMKYQAKCRREAIEQARTLLYHQTDRVKTFHGALLLSEVMRERDAQVKYKEKKLEAANTQDQTYIDIQEKERLRGIATDEQSALERAKAKHETSNFQALQIAEKQKLREKEKEEDYAEKMRIDKEVNEFLKTEAELQGKKTETQVKLRRELDDSLREEAEREAKRQQQEQAEEEGRKLFQQAKKVWSSIHSTVCVIVCTMNQRMTRLRKEKEKELHDQFVCHQQKMADLLESQRQQESNIEDEAIAKAIQEQDAKKEKAEQEKQRLFTERTQDIQRHRMKMIAERKQRERDEKEANRNLLNQKREHDIKFHQGQQEKTRQAYKEATELQQFLRSQVAERQEKMEAEEREDMELYKRNLQLMEVEERQFGEYVHRVLGDARIRGAPTKPLIQAARPGAGGGKGPTVTSKAGLRPSYKAMDATAVELPCYHSKAPPTPANTQKRMGFTW